MKRFGMMVLAIALLVLISGCEKAADPVTATKEAQIETQTEKPVEKKDSVKLSMGSGTSGGTFFIYSGGVAKVVNSVVPGVEILVESTAGSPANLSLLQKGDLQICVAEAGPAYERWSGTNLPQGEKKFEELRALTPMYVAHFGGWTLDKDVKNFEQLAGKSVAMGPYASGADTFSRNVLKTLGIEVDIQNMGWGDCFAELADGRIYAVTGGTGHPSPAIMELEAKTEVNHIRLTDDQIKKILQDYVYYSEETLPGETYHYLGEDYKTVGVWAVIYTTKDMDEEIAYQFTKAIMENNKTLVETHPTAKQSLPQNILKQPIPVHKGAAKYYKEIGIGIPSDKIVD